PYSQLARIGDLLMLSGQIAVDDDGQLVGIDSMAAQGDRIFEIVAALLAAHGATMADIAHVRTFVTDLNRLAELREVRRRWFPGQPPASTTVEVARLFHPDALLEVEVTASVPAADQMPVGTSRN
ncbi:RidA family protein, partial [Micromonospora sp. KC213]|uniref:RidA family protein n=1 Tax=Micromonospora sp. KC213 TaxID=2530378 RepID=UPI001044FF3C